jgi:hypothetical protein
MGDASLADAAADVPDGGKSDGATSDDAVTADRPDDVVIVAPDGPAADATPTSRLLGFTPSNFMLPDSVTGGAGPPTREEVCAVGTCLLNQWTTVTMSDGSLASLAVVKSLLVERTYTFGIGGTRPTIIVALETVDIQGPVVVTPGSSGGFYSGSAPGPGAGATDASGAAGGSYCGVGGPAGSALGGGAYGTPALDPLIGGSTGGGGGRGLGGGALQIIAGKSIIVRALGSISVGGGGGSGRVNNAAGGSGGALLLEAPSVTILGKVAANGGGGGGHATDGASGAASDHAARGGAGDADGTHGAGGDGSALTMIDGSPGQPRNATTSVTPGMGGGGAGRIRINTATGSATVSGVVSPSLTTACATQGVLK